MNGKMHVNSLDEFQMEILSLSISLSTFRFVSFFSSYLSWRESIWRDVFSGRRTRGIAWRCAEGDEEARKRYRDTREYLYRRYPTRNVSFFREKKRGRSAIRPKKLAPNLHTLDSLARGTTKVVAARSRGASSPARNVWTIVRFKATSTRIYTNFLPEDEEKKTLIFHKFTAKIK